MIEEQEEYSEEEAFEEEETQQQLFEHYRFEADPGQQPIRIDLFLMDRIQNATRNKIQNGIRNGFVLVNELVRKANYKVRPGDVITVNFPTEPRDTDVVPEDIPLDIRYEDDDVLVVYKPAGMVVHPAYQNWTGTLVNALAFHFQNLPENRDGRPGLVHRIDKDTSGLLVVAKSDLAMQKLVEQFKDHSIDRTYRAVVWGVPAEEKGTITGHLGRSMTDRRVVTVYPEGEQGKHAVTHYKVLKSWHYVSLIECVLETGRTHQIRAHMRWIGHPLFNDEMYGGARIVKGTSFTKYKQFVDNCFKILPRQALHAKSLGFVHPRTGERMFFDTDLPEDMVELIDKWERYAHTEGHGTKG